MQNHKKRYKGKQINRLSARTKVSYFRRPVGSSSTDAAELRSWAVNDTASRGSAMNVVPETEESDKNRQEKLMKEVRLSLTDLQNNPYHPDLDVKAIIDNVKRFYDKAPTWSFPIGQNAALRMVYKIHSYADFQSWIFKPTAKPGNLRLVFKLMI